jgi:hypothetical protein
MTKVEDNRIAAAEAVAPGDREAIAYFRQALAAGRPWYPALLGAIGLWASAEEVYHDRTYHYLIEGEAFDWLLLAERLCEAADGLLPEDEKDALLFHGVAPVEMTPAEVRELIGDRKYRQYLNYFYGVTVEETLLLAVQAEVDKERRGRGFRGGDDATDEAYLRIYGAGRDVLIRCFREEKGLAMLKSTGLAELKRFTYWLFKYRLRRCEKAKIASDTKKALDFLQQQWQRRGIRHELAADVAPRDGE